MRRLLPALMVTALAVGCRAPQPRAADLALHRERESLDFQRRRGEAVLDLTGQPPSNGADAYYQQRAERHRSR